MRGMPRLNHCVTLIPLAGVLLTALAGCTPHTEAQAEAPALPKARVSRPEQRDVTGYVDLTGRTAAVETVDIRARVSGYLQQVLFEPGSEVTKGQPLFKIDPRPYEAALEQARGQVIANEARLALAVRDFERLKPLLNKGAITPQDFDKVVADKNQVTGDLTASRGKLHQAELDLSYTDVTAPIDGRISRNLITVGNLVTQDQTLLTTLVSQDPMYAYFDVDERTMLHIQELIRQGKFKSARRTKDVPVYMELPNETDFPHHGTINFVDNQVQAATGSLAVRGVFDNPPDAHGDRRLNSGLFVRIRVPLGSPHPALLISDRAIGTDQGQKFVFVVDEQDTVQRRLVQLGALHDGLREVVSGLKPEERVVIAGLQRLLPGIVVRPEEVKKPVPARPSAEGAP